ncbi:DUF4446 family protein [Candidatus Parcubacteria bacterium]|nr:DUF4446 family protein [Candidatus Parcubacteria bacterium]
MEEFILNNLIYIILGVLFVFNLFLVCCIFKLKKRIDTMLQGEEENLEKVLISQIEKVEKQKKDIEKIMGEMAELTKISQKSIQKIGTVRFNPFNEVGSDQSFSIALLDAKNSGFIITSHYGKEFSRIYGKPVRKGESKYLFSKEEKQAIQKAVRQ